MKDNKIIPVFTTPKTWEEACEIAQHLTGAYWRQFSPPRVSPKSTRGHLGGQHFLALRINGPRSELAQGLCWLCGQEILNHVDLIIALGRKPKLHKASNRWEETTSGKVQEEPSSQLLAKIQPYGLDTWPIKDFEKKTGKRDYDQYLPTYAEIPYIYVIEDKIGHVKVGISREPRWRFRQLESSEKTTLNSERCYCTSEPTRYALTIEQAVLNRFGKGRNTRKKSEEWLWEVTFEEAKAAVERELAQY